MAPRLRPGPGRPPLHARRGPLRAALMLGALWSLLSGCKPASPGPAGGAIAPFNPNAAGCYQRLGKVNPAFQQGYRDVAALLARPAPLVSLLPGVVAEHERVLQAGRAAPASSRLPEEDVYVCCVRDTLEGRVAREVKAAVASDAGTGDTRARLEALLEALHGLPWSGPKWTEQERPAIEKHVRDALAALP
ncbi:hypothetical protein HMI49_27070 [Corallococcus exercitus]|uniref:Uncharacterized protein n=1 Tax=Corallococcus exercitus TaxID=2316736 RepID=A0A7Y4NTH1_9BACT|nr:hypothetical protein [Corallococcus exercitus]NOK36875.1 hypothetical protein [Corallococcus exercitus]